MSISGVTLNAELLELAKGLHAFADTAADKNVDGSAETVTALSLDTQTWFCRLLDAHIYTVGDPRTGLVQQSLNSVLKALQESEPEIERVQHKDGSLSFEERDKPSKISRFKALATGGLAKPNPTHVAYKKCAEELSGIAQLMSTRVVSVIAQLLLAESNAPATVAITTPLPPSPPSSRPTSPRPSISA